MQNGDILVFDTDLVGAYGYRCGTSCTWIVGDDKPNAEQKALYQIAHQHVMANIDLIESGMAFTDMTLIAHRLTEEYRALRYGVLAHGVGLCDEYPCVRYPQNVEGHGYGGRKSIKLKEQVLLTEEGAVPLSLYRYEEDFMD